MPTSVTGNSVRHRRWRGFTMVELLVVMAIIAFSVALVAVALPDGQAARLEEEGARLTALLETARAESRVTGAPVVWVPGGPTSGLADVQGQPVHFRFVGLPKTLALPSRWLDPQVTAQVVGARSVVLGPSAILPPQRIVLALEDRRLELASDGLGPFEVSQASPDAPRP